MRSRLPGTATDAAAPPRLGEVSTEALAKPFILMFAAGGALTRLVATSLGISGEHAQFAETYGQGGQGGGRWLVEQALERSGADTISPPVRGVIVVRGRLAGRHVEAVWQGGRVSGDPLVVTMVEQLVRGHELDLNDPWDFLLLMSSAVEQGTLDASGDLPRADLAGPVG